MLIYKMSTGLVKSRLALAGEVGSLRWRASVVRVPNLDAEYDRYRVEA